MWQQIDYWLLQFMRFGLSVDRYCAERSGNKVWLRDCNQRISSIDKELDKWAINQYSQ